MTLDLSTLSAIDRQSYLNAAIAPRPVCFASTIDAEGTVNLSPFSFFNVFSITPAILVFSPSRRVRDNSTKHTLDNVRQVPEVVINIVDYAMVQQMSLASCEYPKEVNEFIKAGFSQEPATLVRPPMVRESKIRIECKVLEIKALGDQGGAGNLVICEALRMHMAPGILDEHARIDQLRMQHVARLGGDWYCRVDEQSLFQVAKPNTQLGIGIDALPLHIRNSSILSGNDLGQLANVPETPVVDPAWEDDRLKQIFQYFSVSPEEMEKELHRLAKLLLAEKKVWEAWQVLLALN